MLDVFIGYDSREEDAFNVARASLLNHATRRVHVRKIDLHELRVREMFRRVSHRDEKNHRIDEIDGLPFSTDFAFTRFLVPYLTLQRWAVFCDSDFLFRSDVAELLKYQDSRYAVRCVKHNHHPTETLKMSGEVQSSYPRKNWSSFVLWNLGHPGNCRLTLKDVNTRPGRWLHTFQWLLDEEIGELPEEWNWLEGSSSPSITPKAVHYTRGVPTHQGMADIPYAQEWRDHLHGHRRLPHVSGAGEATAPGNR